MRCPEKAHPEHTGIWTGLETDILTQFGVKIRHRRTDGPGPPRRSKTTSTSSCVKKYQEKEDLVGPE